MGGVAVAYRHARGLAARGHDVTVGAPRRREGVRGRILHGAVRLRDWAHGIPNRPPYDEAGVRTIEPETWRGLEGVAANAVIAVGHQSIPWALSLTAHRRATGIYMIQDGLRHGLGTGSTWDAPLVRVAVSSWIASAVEAAGAPVEAVVPNAVDHDVFFPVAPVTHRDPRVIALYHRHPIKGPTTLIETLHRMRAMRPDVQADVVSARPPRHRLPPWVDVHVRPEAAALAGLYNRAAVCLHTSRLEGWGLVPMEAAACGCAVVATESRGVNEFLTPGRSMLQVPVDDTVGLAREALRLLSDVPLRRRIAEAGIEDVGRFSWEASTEVLEEVLLRHVSRR